MITSKVRVFENDPSTILENNFDMQLPKEQQIQDLTYFCLTENWQTVRVHTLILRTYQRDIGYKPGNIHANTPFCLPFRHCNIQYTVYELSWDHDPFTCCLLQPAGPVTWAGGSCVPVWTMLAGWPPAAVALSVRLADDLVPMVSTPMETHVSMRTRDHRATCAIHPQESVRLVSGTLNLQWTGSSWTSDPWNLNSGRRRVCRTGLIFHSNSLRRHRWNMRPSSMRLVPGGPTTLTVYGTLPLRVSPSQMRLADRGTFLPGGGSSWHESPVHGTLTPVWTGSSRTCTLGWPVPMGSRSRVLVHGIPIPLGNQLQLDGLWYTGSRR